MVDYNIEFAHIYIDEIYNESYREIADSVKKITKDLEKRGKSYNLTVLIDDYNPILHNLDINGFVLKLGELGVKPDFVIFESELIKLKEKVFSLIHEGRVKKSYQKYIQGKNHVPCSFLIVAWYFFRLGLINLDTVRFYIKNEDKDFFGNKLINVLQSKYTKVEDKAKDIILDSDCSSCLDDIEYRFI